MHIDFAHALVSAVLILATLAALRHFGFTARDEEGRRTWDWRVFGAVFAVIFLLNLIWPGMGA